MEYEIYHHGIKGMKWGVRRFQNKNGGLTPAGKKRYNRKDSWSEDARTASQIKKKSVNQMSNAELKKINERTRLEQEYSRLNPKGVKKGWKYVVAAAGIMGTTVGVYNNANTIIKVGKPVVDKIVNAVGDMVINDLNRHL